MISPSQGIIKLGDCIVHYGETCLSMVIRGMNDLELFGEMQKGDTKALEILFDKYYNVLANFAYLFLNDSEKAKCVVSELFIHLWEKKETIIIRDNFKSYLYKSVRNAIISLKRKEKWTIVSFEDIEFNEMELMTPETLLFNKEIETNIKKLLYELPKKSGLVFRMKKIDGLKYKEIAEILGVTEKTVENHIGNAVKKLRVILEKHPEIIDYFTDL